MRQLATVRRISAIDDIPGKDLIGLAHIDGWEVIVRKAEFKPGDLCIYFEIDSLLPQTSEFAFMARTNYRVRTMKMAGCYSQGLAIPIPEGKNYVEGQDLTEEYGVTKWERPDATDEKVHTKKKMGRWKYFWYSLKNKVFHKNTDFPTHLAHKTDETRIQNAPFYLDQPAEWVVTEKVDGQSGTYILVKHTFLGFNDYEFIVCSRNRRLWAKDESSYWAIAEKYNLKQVMKDLMETYKVSKVILQGEIIGPGIQGNKYKLEEPDFYVFNLIVENERADSMIGQRVVEGKGLKFVPIIEIRYFDKSTVDDVVKYAHGKSKINKDIYRDGIVCRNRENYLSFKAVDPAFLIKYEE